MERLVISKDKRRLVTESGKPFFWLADTVWTMPTRLKWDDALCLMDKRVQQGFTVLQIVALDPEYDEGIHSPNGEPALFDMKLEQRNEKYFEYLDWLISEAERRGLYVLLLPIWGQMVVGENWMRCQFEKTMHSGNAYEYGQWLGRRYKDRTNIIWCLGGDRQPIHKGVDYKNVWRRLAEGIGNGVTGKELRWNVPDDDWSRPLMTYHPCYEAETGEHSTMSYWNDEDVWIDFIMNQSGHNPSVMSYQRIKSDYDREKTMPVFDGEPAYEKMPSGWPGDFPRYDEWMVRKRAYWSLFAGSFGHTYGHACIWCTISEKDLSKGQPYTWFQSLDHPGAWQMRVMKDFMESRPYWRLVPCQELIGHGQCCGGECLDDHRQACIDSKGTFAFVYLTSGGKEAVDLSRLKAERLSCWWFNPRNGECVSPDCQTTQVPTIIENTHTWMHFQSPDCGQKKDWILVLEDAAAGKTAPGKPLAEVMQACREPEKEDVKVFDFRA